MMQGYALFIDYEYCSGCKSCELACRNELGLERGQWGIKVLEDRPWKTESGRWNWNYIPVPSELCNLCEERFEKNLQPLCVQSCQAKCMEFGTIEEMAKLMAGKNKTLIFRP